jgi:D-xylose reductase
MAHAATVSRRSPNANARTRARDNSVDPNDPLFGFELSPDEMAAISALNRDCRFNDPGVFCEAAFRTFCPIYE